MQHQTGIQDCLAVYQDWGVEFSDGERRCPNLQGIDSPGSSGRLALARYSRKMLNP